MSDFVKPFVEPAEKLAEQIYDLYDTTGQFSLLSADEIGTSVNIITLKFDIVNSSGFNRLSMAGLVSLTSGVSLEGEDIAAEICEKITEDIEPDEDEIALSQPRLQGFFEFGTDTTTFEGQVVPFLNGRNWFVGAEHYPIHYDNNLDFKELSDFLNRFFRVFGNVVVTLSDVVLDRNIIAYEDVEYLKLVADIPKITRSVEAHTLLEGFDSFMDFAGINYILDELRNFVKIANVPQEQLRKAGVEMPQAVLLYGPSGVGKTDLMHATAVQLGAEVIEVNFASLSNMYIGQWAKNIDEIFEGAYSSNNKVMIVMDEFDGLIQTGNPQCNNNIITVLKRQLEKN
ncbi:MAG: AAA family ATPase [Patescibacteria group bacterium]